jgi:hypothetical protein
MTEISYRRHRFPPVIIQHAVWVYLRFTLSYRDVEELLAERGLRTRSARPLSARSYCGLVPRTPARSGQLRQTFWILPTAEPMVRRLSAGGDSLERTRLWK